MRVPAKIVPLIMAICACVSHGEAETTSMTYKVECEEGKDIPEYLYLGVIESVSYSVDGWKLFATEVGNRMGVPLTVKAVRHYDELISLLERKEVDFAVIPPLAYVYARKRDPCIQLLFTMVGNGDVYYSGYILVRKDSDITTLRDLEGRRIGFSDRRSASSFLFPLARLLEAGLDIEKLLSKASFLEDHASVLKALVEGQIDAGASYYGALKAARERKIDVSGLRVLAITGRIPFDAIVARKGLALSVIQRFTNVVMNTNTANMETKFMLSGLGSVNGFVPTDDSFYDPIRRVLAVLRAAGLEEM